MLKKLSLALLALLLLLGPLAGRWLYFYQGRYRPQTVARPDLSAVEAPTPATAPFADRYTAPAPGTILVDMAHGNRVEMAELDVLQARLAARGQQLQAVESVDELAGRLRLARALVIIAPGQDWTPAEVQQVEEFVDKGGRLLLVTDPTRFDILLDEWGSFAGLDHDVTHLNDLAARFGLVFQADYLYNTVENEGNFRNIRLTDLADHELTQGVDQVVFYAAHSIVSELPPLIAAGGETRSSDSERAGALAVAVLAADGVVLALGDLTFLTEPYNAVYDNDRFIANIADFLSGAQRQYELTDFPYFFDDEVDLVYAGDPLLDSDLLAGGGALQTFFADRGKTLTLREEEDKGRDTLFFGLYEQAGEVEPYLAAAQVALLITSTTDVTDEAEPPAAPVPSATPSLTTTASVTPSLEITVTPGLAASSEVTVTTEASPTARSRIEIESLGRMALTGTALLLLQSDGERDVLVALADTEAGLDGALKRLTAGNLAGCLLRETEWSGTTTSRQVLALCPTGEVAPGDGGGGWVEPRPEPLKPAPTPSVTVTVEAPPAEAKARIIIVALDEGQGRYDRNRVREPTSYPPNLSRKTSSNVGWPMTCNS